MTLRERAERWAVMNAKGFAGIFSEASLEWLFKRAWLAGYRAGQRDRRVK